VILALLVITLLVGALVTGSVGWVVAALILLGLVFLAELSD
jgi:hypothetical protein